MGDLYVLELEPEVRSWLERCSQVEYESAEHMADRLAEEGELLGFPASSHLGGPVRELRVGSVRVTYWLAPGRRAVLLTVFRKTRQRESREVERAHRVQQECAARHAPAEDHDVYDRETEER